MGFIGSPFTWYKRKDSRVLLHERLDRGLCNSAFYSMFPYTRVSHLDFRLSDHCPLLIETNKLMCRPNRPCKACFRFEEVWTQFNECRVVVERGWALAHSHPNGD